MMIHSIRWRLQLWYGLVFLVLLTGFGITAYELEHSLLFRDLDGELQRRLGQVSNGFRPPRPPGPFGGGDLGPGRDGPPDGEPPDSGPSGGDFNNPRNAGLRNRLPPETAVLFEGETNVNYFVVWARDGGVHAHSSGAPEAIPRPPLPPRPTFGDDADGTGAGLRPPPAAPEFRLRGHWRETFHTMPGGVTILVGRNIEPLLADLRWTALALGGVGAIILVIGLAGGWWVASRSLRPVEEISATAVKIAAGDLSQRIDAGDAESELGRLATVLNSTFARLESAFAQQQQFTADAAHELRTPITVMLTQTQTVLSRDRAAADYRVAVEACQRAAQRMRGLMESLLQLARLDAGQESLQRAPIDLAQLARENADLLRPLAAERNITIKCSAPPLPCQGDPIRMGQVLANLLNNAIEYNKPGGEVRIAGAREGEALVLTIADDGPGIPPDDLPRIFERFYRADKSRSGAAHAGLGLAISNAIITAHGGTIEAANQPGSGAIFTIRL